MWRAGEALWRRPAMVVVASWRQRRWRLGLRTALRLEAASLRGTARTPPPAGSYGGTGPSPTEGEVLEVLGLTRRPESPLLPLLLPRQTGPP